MKDDCLLEVDKFKKSGLKVQIATFKLPKSENCSMIILSGTKKKKIQTNKSRASQG